VRLEAGHSGRAVAGSRDAPSRLVTGRGVPPALAAPALLGFCFLLVPLLALLVRAPWRGLPRLLSDPTALTALRLSLECATAATAVSLVLGAPLAWVLARARFPGLAVLRALVTVPLVLPPVVGGLALLLAFGRNGLAGRYLQAWFGFTLPFSTAGVVVAETFVAMPFLVVAVEGALRSADRDLEEAAATLGARRLAVFGRVTLPLVAPSVLAGAVLCWARALGEFGATITFAGNYPGTTQTMPLTIYDKLQTDPEPAIALSLVLLLAAAVVLALLRDRWLRTGSQGRVT
jgi:molybdate transport system permease protein